MRRKRIIKRGLSFTITAVIAYHKSCMSLMKIIPIHSSYLVPRILRRWGTAFYHTFVVQLVLRLNQLREGVLNAMILLLQRDLTKFHKLVDGETTRWHELFVNGLCHLLRQTLWWRCESSCWNADRITYLECHIESKGISRIKRGFKRESIRFIFKHLTPHAYVTQIRHSYMIAWVHCKREGRCFYYITQCVWLMSQRNKFCLTVYHYIGFPEIQILQSTYTITWCKSWEDVQTLFVIAMD